MALIHWLQRLADVIPATEVSLLIIGLVAVVAALQAWRRPQRIATGCRAQLAYLTLAPAALLVLRHGAWWLFASLAAAALLALILTGRRSAPIDPCDDPPPTSRRAAVSFFATIGALTALLLFADLGGYLGRVMIWEYDTSWNLVQTVLTHQSTGAFLGSRLGWNLGLVSTGDDALLFGGGVRMAWGLLPISIASLRLPAALLALACLPAAWLAGRCCAGRTAATWATATIAVGPALIYYGRYGTSLSGSLFAVLLALAACCALVCTRRCEWWRGLVAGGALFIATLGYSPARLTVVGMLAATALIAVAQSRSEPRRLSAVVALAACVGLVWFVQLQLGRTSAFVDVRGEQIFRMTAQSGWLQDYLDLELSPDELDWADRVAVAGRLLEDTLPQLGRTLGRPLTADETADRVLCYDPPRLPLYQPWALVFTLWGLAVSLRRPLQPPQLLLCAAFMATILPVLFTTRVDAHRMFMLVGPMVLWTGIGISSALATARSLGTPKILLQVGAASILVLAAADSSRMLYYPERPLHPTAGAVLEEVMRSPGPVVVIAQLDFQDLGPVVLAAAERQRRAPTRASRVLHRDLAFALSDAVGPTEEDLPVLVSAARRGAAMLVPAAPYGQLAELAETNGLTVERRGGPELDFWWVSSSD